MLIQETSSCIRLEELGLVCSVITRNLYMLALIVTDLLGYCVCGGKGGGCHVDIGNQLLYTAGE